MAPARAGIKIVLFLVVAVAMCGFYWPYVYRWPRADDFFLIDWFHQFGTGDISVQGLLNLSVNNHPVGALAISAVGLFTLFGPDLRILLALQFLALLSSAALPAIALRRETGIWIFALLPLLAFHPMQTTHLLWAFELCWATITFCLVVSLLLLEIWGVTGLALAIIPCIVAMLSSAHGSAVPVVLAIQSLTLPGLARIKRISWAAAFVVIFVAGRLLLPGGDRPIQVHVSDFFELIGYAVQMVGATFGSRNPALLWTLGLISLMVCFVSLVLAAKQPSQRTFRVCALLILASTAFVSLFTIGRYQYGVPWALSHFHIAPLFVPYWLGMGALALANLRSKQISTMIVGAASLALLLGSWIGSSLDGFWRARESYAFRALSMERACRGGQPDYLLAGLSALGPNVGIIHASWPILKTLCAKDIPAAAAAFDLPASYIGDGFRTLWNVYSYRGDLRAAFPVDDPATPCRLARWSAHDAATGSNYEPRILRPFATELTNHDAIARICRATP